MARNFRYKVTRVTPDYISVEFNNNTTADVPVFKGESKSDIEARISDYYFPLDKDEHNILVSEVPFEVGDANTCRVVERAPVSEPNQEDKTTTVQQIADILKDLAAQDDNANIIASIRDNKRPEKVAATKEELNSEEKHDYHWMRLRSYPVPTEVLWAQWRARNGDHKPQAEIDAKYKAVDAMFPETMEPMTLKEFKKFKRKYDSSRPIDEQ